MSILHFTYEYSKRLEDFSGKNNKSFVDFYEWLTKIINKLVGGKINKQKKIKREYNIVGFKVNGFKIKKRRKETKKIGVKKVNNNESNHIK